MADNVIQHSNLGTGYLVEWDDEGEANVPSSPSLPVSSSSAASATKDAPFVNTLGMKSVPVPITYVFNVAWLKELPQGP